MRSWPLDLAEGIEEALRNPGAPAVRGLLAATLEANESGGVFVGPGSDVRLLTAVPSDAPFHEPSIRELARSAIDRGGDVEEPTAGGLSPPRAQGAPGLP